MAAILSSWGESTQTIRDLVWRHHHQSSHPTLHANHFFSINPHSSWWRHQMETFSALLALCAGNSPVIGEFPLQRPVTGSFDVFFDLHLNKCLSKQSWGLWSETPSSPLWRHCKVTSHELHKHYFSKLLTCAKWRHMTSWNLEIIYLHVGDSLLPDSAMPFPEQTKIFIEKKHSKCLLQNLSHFVQASLCWWLQTCFKRPMKLRCSNDDGTMYHDNLSALLALCEGNSPVKVDSPPKESEIPSPYKEPVKPGCFLWFSPDELLNA